MQKTELDDLVVISWKLAELGSEKFERYSKEVNLFQNSLFDSYYILKTCERIVIAFLCSTDNYAPNTSQCSLCSSKKICLGKDLFNLYSDLVSESKIFIGLKGFRYLSLVASSLDSSTIGEHEILGQFKKAFVSQQESKTLYGSLYEIVVFAYKAGKKVHSSSDIPKGRVSILSNAEKIFDEWVEETTGLTNRNLSIAILGTGKMGQDAYKYFRKKPYNINVFSRNRSGLESQESEIAFESFEKFEKDLNNQSFDVLILCSSTNEPFITKEFIGTTKNLLIFDLGVPKNADPSINEIPSITLYQMDQLVQLSEMSYNKRAQSLGTAFQIIDEQVIIVSNVFEKRMINPFIKNLRLDLESVAKKRLDDYTNNKELPIEFYKWFNNTIKEMMHVSQEHLEKGINKKSKSNADNSTIADSAFQLFTGLQNSQENNINKVQ